MNLKWTKSRNFVRFALILGENERETNTFGAVGAQRVPQVHKAALVDTEVSEVLEAGGREQQQHRQLGAGEGAAN